ncbi:RabGAP/TBC [Neoconidiobolus thromboides FSU 785]|nr:RabGAP/TBC [Neoconidiobolus thromboides FSU 785]
MKYNIRKKLFSDLLSYPVLEQDESYPELNYVDMDQLRKLCSNGIPDVPGYRPLCWKLLLRTLPSDKRLWSSHLADSRRAYYGFVKDLVEDQGHRFPLTEQDKEELRKTKINQGQANILKDSSLLEQIDMDVRRTLSDHAFFQLPVFDSSSRISTAPSSPISEKFNFTSFNDILDQPTPFENISAQDRRYLFQQLSQDNIGVRKRPEGHKRAYSCYGAINRTKNSSSNSITTLEELDGFLSDGVELTPITSNELLTPQNELEDKIANHPLSIIIPQDEGDEIIDLHWEAMERILFIYAKLNPGVGYVQGMNEILGPIYYVVANDSPNSSLMGREHAEADAFYLFTAVMGSVRDQYVKQLDRDKRVGVSATIKLLECKLKQVSPELYQDLKNKGLDPTYFAFRWITVLGSQEFDLPDVIRLWDALFSHTPIYLASENGFPSVSPASNISPLNTMVMVGVAMLCLVKDQLLIGNFADNLKLLQNYPKVIDISNIIDLAYRLEALPPNTNLDLMHLLPNNNKEDGKKNNTLFRALPNLPNLQNVLNTQQNNFSSLLQSSKKRFFNPHKRTQSTLSANLVTSWNSSWNNTIAFLSNKH